MRERLGSIGLRAAAAAALVCALIFLGGGLLLREMVYSSRLRAEVDKARSDLTTMLRLAEVEHRIPGSTPMSLGISFMVVHTDGTVLASTDDIAGFSNFLTLLPAPPPGGVEPIEQRYTARFGSSPGHVWDGREIPVLDGTVQAVNLFPNNIRMDDGDRVRVYVFIDVTRAEEALEGFDRALWIGLPVTVLAVALVAWLATSRALRPVERIRSRAAEISASALHQRVPVPASNDEVSRLAVTLNETLARLEESALRQQRFVGDAAHELRSPIATVRTVLEVALEHPTLADWPSVVATAAREAARLDAVADDLLLLARLDTDQPGPPQPVDLGFLVRSHVDSRTDADALDCRVVRPTVVGGTARRLERLVRNLIDNAVRHARSRVAVTVRGEGGWVVLVVADDGPGIPAPERERVFERFTRLDESRTRKGAGTGTGLGLAIARGIATQYGGTLVVVESDDLGGAALLARLPAYRQHPAQD